MLSTLLNLVPGIGPVLANWKLIAIGVLGLALAFFAWDWEHRGKVIEEQQANMAVLQANLETAKTQQALAIDAQNALSVRLTEVQGQKTKIVTITERARNAPSSDDGALAPVLRDAIAGIGGLRNAPAKPR